ncbi:MAG: DUF4198 domain-containing protein [Oleiphilaceae bacterium]|nr:DUF4198 domain-containing protein [Oleiphilaceae bacterium]
MQNPGKKCITGAILLAAITLPGLTYGHYSWVAPESLTTETGSDVSLVFGWGHHPGEGDSLEAGRMASLSHWGPDGQWQGLPLHGSDRLGSGTLSEPGIHTLAAQQSRSYWSRTVEGGRRGSLREYPNASRCSYSNNASKAIIQVGESDRGAEQVAVPLGQPLEIVPQALPASLEKGQPVRVQVLLHGAPLGDATVTAYRGDHSEERTADNGTTDARGMASLDLATGHAWLLHVEAAVPFHDQSLCHEHSLNGTVMFTR